MCVISFRSPRYLVSVIPIFQNFQGISDSVLPSFLCQLSISPLNKTSTMSSISLLPRVQQCTDISADCPVSKSFYGYSPSLGPDITLLVLFTMALVGHGVQGWYYRAWGTLIAMSWGCICEVLGYIGRLMMHPNAFNLNGSVSDGLQLSDFVN